MHDFSNNFKERIKSLNVQSISDKILTVLNNAFDSVQRDDSKVLISFKEFESNSVLNHIFTVNVDFVKLSKNVLKINNLDSLSIDIIKTCRTQNFDKTLENENYLTIEKYAIQDFVTEILKDYFKESIVNEKVYTISVKPQDALLIVNDKSVTTINGTYSDKAPENTEIKVYVSHDNYEPIEENIVVTSDKTLFNFNLEPVLCAFNLVTVPETDNVHLYKKVERTYLNEKTGTALKESTKPSSFVFSDPEYTYSEIPLVKNGRVYQCSVNKGSEFVLRVKKRLYKDISETILFERDIFKVLDLEKYCIPVKITGPENCSVYVNDELVEIPYKTELGVNEGLKIEALSDTGEVYKNFVIGNESNISTGLEFNINFTKMFDFDIKVEDSADLFINNLKIDSGAYSEKLIEGSVVDVRVEKSGYVPVTERFYITHDIEKEYTLTEKLPEKVLSISVEPQDAYLMLNGQQVTNPYTGMYTENSEIQIKVFKSGYKAITENIIVNSDIEKNYILEEVQINKPILNIDCNVEDAVLVVNNDFISLPASIYGNPGSLYSIMISKEGYKTYTNEIRLVENTDLHVELEELSSEELTDKVKLNVKCSKLNSLIMINGVQVDNNSTVEYPRGTILDIEVTYPGYATGSSRMTISEDTDLNIVLEKTDNLSSYRVYIYNTTGATLTVNDKQVAAPFVSDFEYGSKVKIKSELDGYETYENELFIDQDYIIYINLEKIDETTI
jgi:hypothetical protein